MSGSVATYSWTVLAVTGVAYLLGTYRARAERDEPGGSFYLGLGLALGIGAWVVGAGIGLGDPTGRRLLAHSFEAIVYLLPVLWVAFAARRTGTGWLTNRRLAVIAVCLAALVAEYRLAIVLLGDEFTAVESFVPSFVLAVTVPWIVATVIVGGLMVIGVTLIARQALEYDHVRGAPVAAIAVGVVVPWLGVSVANWVQMVTDPATAGSVAVVGFGVGAVGFLAATNWFDLFAASTAAGTIGPAQVVQTMDDAVLVVDDDGRVIDCNPAADDMFEDTVADVAGRPIAAIVEDSLATLRSSDVIDLPTAFGHREFEPTVSAITGPDGDHLGYSVVLRDVTEHRAREQRLAVLNRVLRHNLRNEMGVVSGYAELIADAEAADDLVEEISETAHDVVDLGEKARTIERMMAEPPMLPEQTRVARIAEDVVAGVRTAAPDCEFDVLVPDDLAVVANPRVLGPVVENLVENAAEHNDAATPRVEIRAEPDSDGEAVVISIADNGPGVPEQERAVLESGDVSPLEHGSGLGLWVSKWGATHIGGSLSLSTDETGGTIARVRVPTSVPDPTVASALAGS